MPVPEPGRVVEVRGATWAVADVREQGLGRSPADEAVAGTQHLVDLQSLDEDRLGEQLSVIWELEVGATVAPDQGLPTTITAEGFDEPDLLAAFVDAVRWGAVTSADDRAYQAPFRTGANIEAFQLEPLRRALTSPRTNLLLADDVGLGKTIEAGLVVQELLLRHRARSVVIVCPPSLALKWQDEMRDKFGLDFTVVNSALMSGLRRSHGLAANPFRLFPRVIVSMAWLPKPRAQRLLRDVYGEVGRTGSARRYAFDVLVVDEAHHVAPSSPGGTAGGHRGYAIDSQRTIATRHLAERCEHRLFLSATPHNGHTESFTALLEMIDDRRFQRGASVDEQALREVTVRRLKTQLPEKGFKARRVRKLSFEPADDEQEMFALLDRLLRESAGERSVDIVAMLLKKRFLSSPWAFGLTMALYGGAHDGRAGTDPDLDDEYYREVFHGDEEEGLVEHPELGALQAHRASNPLSAATPEEVERLTTWGQGYQHRPDSRLQALTSMLDATCRIAGGHWSNERVVVFTEYAATLDWIVDNLRQRGYDETRLEVIQGSTDLGTREEIRQRFATDPSDPDARVRVLVATDSAGEGIDLQAHCHRLVNFDIPFNPGRLEQRIGRIDRYGQGHAPEVTHLVPVVTATTFAEDLKFMGLIAEKVATIAGDLGSVNPVIDADIQNRFGVSGRSVRPAPVDADSAIINKTLAGELELNKQLTELAGDHDRHRDAMHLRPLNARRVVDTALTLGAQPTLVEIGDDRTDAGVYAVPALGPRWQPALRGLDTLLKPGVLRPVTFDPDAARDRTDLVHVHLGHALLQTCSRLLRRALFSTDAQVNRVTAVVVDDLDQSCAAAVSRLVLVGRGGLRLHEEVFLTGIRLKGQDLAEDRIEVLLDRSLDREGMTLAAEPVRRRLAHEWDDERSRMRDRLENAVERRAQRRQQQVADRLDRRESADADRARAIFASFRTNLTESLERLETEGREAEQMLIDEQRAQRTRDLRSIRERLDRLVDDERRELTAIGARYANVRPYISSAALIFALTPADAADLAARA